MTIDPGLRIRIAAFADVYPTTVVAYFDGKAVRPRTVAKIERALAELKIPPRSAPSGGSSAAS